MFLRIYDSLLGVGINFDEILRNGEFINYYDGELIWLFCEMNGIYVDLVISAI